MPIPKDPEAAVPVLVRMSHEMSEQIKSIAADESRSMASVVRDLVRAQLNLPRPERDTLPLDLPGRSSAA